MQSDEIVENSWTRARSQCECDRPTHSHAAHCGTALVWEHRGKGVAGGWEAVTNGPKAQGGWQAVQACRILCWNCYQKVTAGAANHIQRTMGADAEHPNR